MGAARSVVTKLLRLLAVVLIVSFLTFSLTKLLPGDPVNVILGPQASNQEVRAAVEKDLGLDKPFFGQYVSYIGSAIQGDLGRSYTSKFETTTLLGQRLPATIELMLLAQVLSLLISIPLAMYSAYRANTRADKAITTAAFGLISFPNYALAVALVWLFALKLGWFPAIGYVGLDQGIGAVVWSPLGWGRLTGRLRRGRPMPKDSRLHVTRDAAPPVPDEYLFTVVDALDGVAQETGRTITQVAINWLLQRPTVSTVIVGARNEEQLRQNLGAVGWNLEPDQVARLDAASDVPLPYPYWHQRLKAEVTERR